MSEVYQGWASPTNPWCRFIERGRTLAESLTFVTGVATRGGMTAHRVEEASLLPLPSLQARGNLYLVASGVPSETDAALKAVRDQYYGEAGPPADAATSLREALETANTLLTQQRAIGVSCLAAAIADGARLTVVAAGAGAAFLFSAADGLVEDLVDPSATLVGAQPVLTVSQASRRLRAGDVLILASAALAETLEAAEIGLVVAQAGSLGPQGVADQLLARAYGDTPGGSATALVVSCAAAAEPRPAAPRPPAAATRPTPSPRRTTRAEATPRRTSAPEPLPRDVSDARPWRQWSIRAALGLALLAAIGYGASRLLLPSSEATPTASPTVAPTAQEAPLVGVSAPISPVGTPAPGTEAAWRRINELWPEGDKGNIAALQEIVGLLEQLKAQTPGDFTIDEKLSVARVNLAYRRGMRDVDRNWPTTTAAASVVSWSLVVETLEGLYPLVLSSDSRNYVTNKLHDAHINYAMALQNAGRAYEAQGNLQRANQIRPP